MAAPCADASQCCTAFYAVALMPQDVVSLGQQSVQWASQTRNPSTGAWPTMNFGVSALRLGAPLQGIVFNQPGQDAKQFPESMPVQCFMGYGEANAGGMAWGAPPQFGMNSAACVPSVNGGSGWGSALAPGQDYMNIESMNEEFIGGGSDAGTPTSTMASSATGVAMMGMSSSMSRRRRRQRAAMKAPADATDVRARSAARAERAPAPSLEVLPEELLASLGESLYDPLRPGDLAALASSCKATRRALKPVLAKLHVLLSSLTDVRLALAEELVEQVRNGNARLAAARFRQLAFADKSSCQVAQSALDITLCRQDAAALVLGMHGHVRVAMRSMFANYVIQKIVETMSWTSASFIPRELLGAAGEMARHRYGCRVFCRLLEHFPLHELHEPILAELLEELLRDAGDLSCHAFGNYVVRHILEFGLPHHRHRIAVALCQNLKDTACHQYGSCVVEAALQFCGVDDQRMLAAELLCNTEQLVALAMSVSGRHVVKALLELPGGYREKIEELLQPAAKQLRESRYGKFVLETMRGASA